MAPVVVGGGLNSDCEGVACCCVGVSWVDIVGEEDESSGSRSGAGDILDAVEEACDCDCDDNVILPNCFRRSLSRTSPLASSTSHSISPSSGGSVDCVSELFRNDAPVACVFAGTSVVAPNIRAPRAR